MTRIRKRFLDCHGLDMQQCTSYGHGLSEQQRDVMFQLGDLVRYAEAKWPDTWQQVFPEWVSPGLLSRAAGVCRAYPEESARQIEATYSQYMQVASRPDRQQRLAEMLEKGQTTDESREADKQQRAEDRQRWLLAVDVSYYLHKHWFSGAGVEAAVRVATWIQRTVERMKEKGLTDVACCFDSKVNNRKELTKDWEDKYKDRPPKDPELVQQLNLVHELIRGRGLSCVLVDGYEADDVMASFAKQFQGRVTLLTQDKDCRQCLSSKCNMLLDVEWSEDESTGESLPEYKWLSASQHSLKTGIAPEDWVEYQTIMGDATDGIKGVIGIGEKGAADLVKMFGTVEGAIAAARADDERIKPAKRKALIEFEAKLEVTRKLVMLVDSLTIPESTRI